MLLGVREMWPFLLLWENPLVLSFAAPGDHSSLHFGKSPS